TTPEARSVKEYELSQNNGSIANKAVLPISSSNLIQDSMLSLLKGRSGLMNIKNFTSVSP
ncbi:hypothetical protein, partial [Neisseria meningitidis]|uniref:hypothetical protein n=1 Tax=Neisseria meningitidis TaxID=487 RepID=UPI0021F0F402